MGVRFKRIFAFWLDWVIAFLPGLILTYCLQFVPNEATPVCLAMVRLLLFVALLAIAFRDVIFGSRSLGKRLMGLHVIDKSTFQVASKKQRMLRGLLFFIYEIDGIILLVTGETLGDRLAKTAVISI